MSADEKLTLALGQLRQNGAAISCLAAALKPTESDKVDLASALTLIQVELRETQRVLSTIANAVTT